MLSTISQRVTRLSIEHGERWTSTEGIVDLRCGRVVVPGSWPVEKTRLQLDVGGEALARLHYEDGCGDAFGVDPFHRLFPVRRRRFDIEVEAVARHPFGVPNRDPRLGVNRLVLVDPVVDRFERLLILIEESVGVFGDHEVCDLLLTSAEKALAQVRWPSETSAYLSRVIETQDMLNIWALPKDIEAEPAPMSEEVRASLAKAGSRLERELEALQSCYPSQGRLVLTGHAHIDVAWLWPLDETRRKAVRTYHTVVQLMDRYPEFRFNQSSAQLYEFIREDDPQLFEEIERRVRSGQWEPIGGMWVEPDANMPSGEALCPQLLYGQRYFQRLFGQYHRVCWMPDCFGFSSGMPQILKAAGIDHFFTIKLTWSETNRFPHDLFWWEGLDGSRVLAHMFHNPIEGYNGEITPEQVTSTWRNFKGKRHSPASLFSAGYGDGGGGPTPEMLERARALEVFPLVPRLQFGRVSQFFEELEQRARDNDLPVWAGELYLELHRGTLTTQAKVKYLHRRAEHDLVAAEALRSLCALAEAPSRGSLEESWRVVLRNEFHDILPGSSIREVYETAEQELGDVLNRARDDMLAGLGRLSELIVTPGNRPALMLVNPDLSARTLRVEAPHPLPGGQAVEGGSVVASEEMVPALGARVTFGRRVKVPATAGEWYLENACLKVSFGEDGTLASVCDKRAGREVLAGRGNQLWAYTDKPREWDAWDIDEGHEAEGEEVLTLKGIEVIENGPHRAAIAIDRTFRDSSIRQEIRLWSNSARLEFKTVIDWHERHILLKALFPVAVHSRKASFETAFGVVERATTRNTSWEQAQFEVPAHRFVDLSEPGYGVALINDGKYGHHVCGNRIGISLLRSPTFPDPRADEGFHGFTYALLPHSGTWMEGGVLAEAEDLNRPLLCLPVEAAEETVWQPLVIEGLPLALGCLKELEDGDGLALRVYEPQGARGRVNVVTPKGWALDAELDLLERKTGDPDTYFGPFKFHTWRLRRK
jgi:alpha-mannosidase